VHQSDYVKSLFGACQTGIINGRLHISHAFQPANEDHRGVITQFAINGYFNSMKAWFNKLMGTYLSTKHKKLMEVRNEPYKTQKVILRNLLETAARTEYGRRYGFGSIRKVSEYRQEVPLTDYEDLKDSINRMMYGAKDVLWPGQVHWFAKSSGTTSARSKFIPIPNENLKGCHHKSSWDALALLYHILPDAPVFHRKSLVMGGSLSVFEGCPDTTYGDISGIMLQHMPAVGRPFFTPDFETALLDDWELKIERMVERCVPEDLGFFGGVPTWLIVLFKRILEVTGKENMLEVWPNLQAYTHGGVGFKPYRETFEKFIPSPSFVYQEVYNATEGFFAAQDQLGTDDMLLLLDNGMFYEFLPLSELNSESPKVLPLKDVETHVVYALVISTSAGLWRYMPGDTIRFTSLSPHRIQVVGRTQQFINAFGEEVMIDNAEKALASACRDHRALVADFTIAPVFLDGARKGRHHWLVEFSKAPDNLEAFAETLDKSLQSVNSDYEAKRSYDLALEQLELQVAPSGTFNNWLASKHKLGGQHKVPRLCNDRRYIDEIIELLKTHDHGSNGEI